MRTSSEPYNIQSANLDQIYVHLTNNAVQKYSKSYGKFEEANIVSVKQLCDELEISTKDVYEMIEAQVVESVVAVQK